MSTVQSQPGQAVLVIAADRESRMSLRQTNCVAPRADLAVVQAGARHLHIELMSDGRDGPDTGPKIVEPPQGPWTAIHALRRVDATPMPVVDERQPHRAERDGQRGSGRLTQRKRVHFDAGQFWPRGSATRRPPSGLGNPTARPLPSQN